MGIGSQFHTNICQYIQSKKGKQRFEEYVEIFDWVTFKKLQPSAQFHICPESDPHHVYVCVSACACV